MPTEVLIDDVASGKEKTRRYRLNFRYCACKLGANLALFSPVLDVPINRTSLCHCRTWLFSSFFPKTDFWDFILGILELTMAKIDISIF